MAANAYCPEPEEAMSADDSIDYEREVPAVLTALVGANQAILEAGFDRDLIHLIELRASQINQCAYCVKMHTREARRDGATNERLDRLVVWPQVDDFSEREKAALAWTEALTYLDRGADYAALRRRLKGCFSDQEIGVLTSVVAMINLWNRYQISTH
jgi:AhpD family alkylhydroperoxidase